MNKSKFLKKSLAMLLALMLVVAMIPLSAAAAIQDDLKYIYVNGAQVSVDELEVDMPSSTLTSGDVTISTNENLAAEGVELRIYEKGGSVLYKTAPQYAGDSTTGDDAEIAKYVNLSSDKTTGTVKLELVATENKDTIADNTVLKTYTLTINFVDDNTTTNLAVVPEKDGTFGDGVYNAYVEGDKIIVETARNNVVAEKSTDVAWTIANDQQKDASNRDLTAKITVKPLEGASLINWSGRDQISKDEEKINANNGNTVTVQSENGQKETTYTVVSRYVDALDSFTVEVGDTNYDAKITDANKDDVVDTLEITLPKSVIVKENGDPDVSPSLPVSYAIMGNVNADVVVKIPDTQNPGTAVKTDGSVPVTFTNLGTKDANGMYQPVEGTVTVTRLGNFVQQYNLVVKLEESTNTTIAYARVNATEATIDGANITAVLPQNYNGIKTDRENLDLVLYTENTVEKVIIGSQQAEKLTGEANDSATQTAWGFLKSSKTKPNNDVDISKPVTISVYAEDGHFEQYTITTSMAEQTNTAGMSAIWLGNGGSTYKGELTGTNEYTIKVPYMTTDISNWTVFATPTAGSKVVYNNGTSQTDIVNGITKASAIGYVNTIDLINGFETTVVGLNMADDTIHTDYTVKVVLEDVKEAKTLTGLDFTAQISTNNTDRLVYRALNTENQFHAYVAQKSNGEPDLNNINLYIPVSLTDHKEDYVGAALEKYRNTVTGIDLPDGAVAFSAVASGTNYSLTELKATENDDDKPVTGAAITNTTKIVVLPEQIARQVITGTGVTTTKNQISQEDAKKHGTVYSVVINKNDPETDSVLNSFAIGEVDLKVVGQKISGELPWSYTVPSDAIQNGNTVDQKYLSYAVNAEFVLSKYAAMRTQLSADSNYGYPLYSNGDTNGDGVADNSATWDGTNMKFLFVRNDDPEHSVTVYRTIWDGSNFSCAEITEVTVRAEDRLTATANNVSQTDYKFVNLTWKEPSKEAEISSFKLANQTGTVTNTSETERTITVNVPYGTDLKGMVATFEASLGAKVKIGTTSGMDFISGVTSLNYTSDVIVYVTSEDDSVTNRYTIKVNEGLSFSDVSENDWFYDNVMDAAENGYVTGMGDGTFAPKKSTTRAEFASMIAKAMGYTAEPDAPSAFPDVADDFWGKAAINFCAQNGIISGYSDGTFQPNKAITRQEAAAILNNAFDLVEKFGTSSDLFSDDAKISGWAETHVYAAKASGLMKGDAAGTFRPTDTIIRAEAASILMNAKYEGLIK